VSKQQLKQPINLLIFEQLLSPESTLTISAVRIVFFISNRIVIVGLKSH